MGGSRHLCLIAKFGVAVFKGVTGGSSAMGICALFYIYIDLPSLV